LRYKAIIIGCGNIAGELDAGQVDSGLPPLTHAKAYQADKNFDLIGCVDPDVEKRLKFCADWSLSHSFSSIKEVISENISVDVISICSPTTLHAEHLELALLLNPKIVFCEKPLCSDIATAKVLIELFENQRVHLVVNYSRRFDPSIISLKNVIDTGEFGELRGISGWYNKGLLNNGSHMLDLLIYLLGDLSIKYVGDAYYDTNEEDPSHPLFLTTKHGIAIALSCGNASDFSLFELDFIFSAARVKMLNGGRQWSLETTVDDATFSGYKNLGIATVSEGGLIQSLQNALLNIHSCLRDGAKLNSSGADAMDVVRLYSEIMEIKNADL
jgi:predicted dehydrogenase